MRAVMATGAVARLVVERGVAHPVKVVVLRVGQRAVAGVVFESKRHVTRTLADGQVLHGMTGVAGNTFTGNGMRWCDMAIQRSMTGFAVSLLGEWAERSVHGRR